MALKRSADVRMPFDLFVGQAGNALRSRSFTHLIEVLLN
jgi:hypothetical protein